MHRLWVQFPVSAQPGATIDASLLHQCFSLSLPLSESNEKISSGEHKTIKKRINPHNLKKESWFNSSQDFILSKIILFSKPDYMTSSKISSNRYVSFFFSALPIDFGKNIALPGGISSYLKLDVLTPCHLLWFIYLLHLEIYSLFLKIY